jgi:hypothetical protein
MDRHPQEVSVPEALADLSRSFGHRQRLCGIAREVPHRGLEEGGEAELDAIGEFVRVSLHPSEPPGAHRRLSPPEVLDAQP